MKLKEAIEIYAKFSALENKEVTAERSMVDARLLCVYLRNPFFEEIKDHHIVAYLEMMKECGYSQNSLAKKVITLRAMWRFFNKKGWRTFNFELIPNMKMEATMPRIATEEGLKKILEIIPDNKFYYQKFRDDALIRLLWDTGARVGEITSLKVSDIDLAQMKAIIRTEKSRGMKPFREIYWTKETNTALADWIGFKRDMEEMETVLCPEFLFWGCTNAGRGMRLSNVAVACLLRKYCRKLKIPVMNPHSFRHHMGHDLAMQGANNSIISSVLGHSSMESSYIYTELTNKEREMAYIKYKRKS